jgi:hypothetical protein
MKKEGSSTVQGRGTRLQVRHDLAVPALDGGGRGRARVEAAHLDVLGHPGGAGGVDEGALVRHEVGGARRAAEGDVAAGTALQHRGVGLGALQVEGHEVDGPRGNARVAQEARRAHPVANARPHPMPRRHQLPHERDARSTRTTQHDDHGRCSSPWAAHPARRP